MIIKEIKNDVEKREITRLILESLTDWFGIPEAREEYISDSKERPFFCAFDDKRPVGFLYLKETGKDTVELAVMGVSKEYHSLGFKEFEVFPTLWDEWNPCQVYVMGL